MMGKTHAIVGVLSLAAFAAVVPEVIAVGDNTFNPLFGLLTVAAGSLAPDVDIEGSKASKKVPFLAKILTHRGITHTLVVPGVLYALMTSVKLSALTVSLIFGFAFGWLMHIAADLLNKKGVPLFWPFITQRVHVATIRTNSYQETLFMIADVVLNLAVIVICGGLI